MPKLHSFFPVEDSIGRERCALHFLAKFFKLNSATQQWLDTKKSNDYEENKEGITETFRRFDSCIIFIRFLNDEDRKSTAGVSITAPLPPRLIPLRGDNHRRRTWRKTKPLPFSRHPVKNPSLKERGEARTPILIPSLSHV